METIKIAHKGLPCDPPIVEGVTFAPLGEDDLYVGEATQDQADRLLRIDAFKPYGGKKAPGGPPAGASPTSALGGPSDPPAGDKAIPSDEEVDALTSHAAAVAFGEAYGIPVTEDFKLADKKVEIKAALAKLREAAVQA